MKIAKLARVIGLGTLVGALSLGGVFYASEYDSIEEAILALRLKAEGWQKQAGLNKAELNEMTDKYNTLEANYKAVLDILNIQDGSDIEEVKAKVEEIYKNATSTGIEGTNIMLEAIAEALGVELTDSDKNANGVYTTDKILAELGKLDDELDKLEEAIGDLSVNLEAGDMEYSDDMSLTEKINYLIGQINLANDEQDTIKKLAEDTLAEVEEASADYVYVEEEEEGGAKGDNSDNPIVAKCETCNQDLNEELKCTNTECETNKESTVNEAFEQLKATFGEEMANKIKDGKARAESDNGGFTYTLVDVSSGSKVEVKTMTDTEVQVYQNYMNNK